MKIAEGILPAGWIGLTLEDAAQIHDNLREPVNSSERAKRPGLYPYYGATGQVGWIDDFRQDGEYVLLGEDGAPFFEPTKEKAYLVSGKCWVNNHAHVLKGREGLCSNRYLLYALNQTNYRGYANGTTRLKLTQSAMRQLPISLAPFAEQHRIVAKIEELFSELDKGIENLKTARAQLKVYRQALLKHAFEGKLTAQWRAERNVIPAKAGIQPFNDMDSRLRGNDEPLETADAMLKRIQQERAQRYQQQLADWEAAGKQGSKPKAPKPLPPLTTEEQAELPRLPDGWGWTRLGNTNVDVSDGPFGSNLKSSDYVDSGVRVVRLENIGTLKFFEEKESYITEEKYELLKRHTVTSGDIIFSSFIIENVRVALVPPSITKAINKADCFCVRFSGETLSNVFVLLFLSTRHVYKQLESLIHGVGRPRINTTQLKGVVIPVCSAAEQQIILAEIEARLSEADQLELTITTSLQQAEALRQSILKKAFSGQLVPQDPHDEPASVLLARIKMERAGSGKSAASPRRIKKVSP